MYRVSFTGYRPAKLPFHGESDPLCISLKSRIYDKISELIEDGAGLFYSGMALGVDMWCAEAVLMLQEQYPDIKLTAIVPCKGQESKWRSADQQRYNDILSRCQQVIYVSQEYTDDCMHRRNRALVDICDILVAVYDGKSGGTKYTVDYARKKGREIHQISPVE